MTDGSTFTFPDDSGRLRALLTANRAVIEHIDLPVVLEKIIHAAVELVGAQYGALGVLAPDGGLEQFIHVGIDTELAARIGHLPEGHGLLGALIADPHAIRIPELSSDPRSVGFPAHHPPMHSFLGVPIRVRNEVYGNLYLSNQASGEFSQEDEQLITALAATAGIAIENARLFTETRRRQAWAAASAEITSALLANDTGDVLSILANRVLELSEADVVWVLRQDAQPDVMVVDTAQGLDHENMRGQRTDFSGSLSASVLEAAQPRLVDDSSHYGVQLSDGSPLGPVMAVPMSSAGQTTGVLLVGRLPGGRRFTRGDLEIAADFAGQASVAMELATARAERERMMLREDRDRIARDLHDHVIQQLFATGLELQSIAGSTSPEVAGRISQAVLNMDASISQIRTVIFALAAPPSGSRDTVRHSIISLVDEFAGRLDHTPTVSFSGPVDLVVTTDLASDVLAVIREALSNVVKHAGATSTAITLGVVDDSVELTVSDNGRGAGDSTRRSGVANLHQRAVLRGGTFEFESSNGGTTITWSAPLDPLEESLA